MHRPTKKTPAPCKRDANPEGTRGAHRFAMAERITRTATSPESTATGTQVTTLGKTQGVGPQGQSPSPEAVAREPLSRVRVAGWTAAEAQPGARLPRRWRRAPGEPRRGALARDQQGTGHRAQLGASTAGRNLGTFHPPNPFLSLLWGGCGEEGSRQQLPHDRKALRVLVNLSQKMPRS